MLQDFKGILTNPQIFNYAILTLYALSLIRWVWERNVGQSVYAIGAVLIVYSLTLMR